MNCDSAAFPLGREIFSCGSMFETSAFLSDLLPGCQLWTVLRCGYLTDMGASHLVRSLLVAHTHIDRLADSASSQRARGRTDLDFPAARSVAVDGSVRWRPHCEEARSAHAGIVADILRRRRLYGP